MPPVTGTGRVSPGRLLTNRVLCCILEWTCPSVYPPGKDVALLVRVPLPYTAWSCAPFRSGRRLHPCAWRRTGLSSAAGGRSGAPGAADSSPACGTPARSCKAPRAATPPAVSDRREERPDQTPGLLDSSAAGVRVCGYTSTGYPTERGTLHPRRSPSTTDRETGGGGGSLVLCFQRRCHCCRNSVSLGFLCAQPPELAQFLP